MDLYINDRMIEDLEQLKDCFRSGDSNVRNELLSYVRNGCLEEWLKEGDSQEEEKLANEVANLDFSADDNILWNDVYKIVVGGGSCPRPQSYSRCFKLNNVSSMDNNVRVRKSAKKYIINLQHKKEAELSFSFKILTLAHASVNLYLCNEQEQRFLLGYIDLKKEGIIKWNAKNITCGKWKLLADDEIISELCVEDLKDLIIPIKEGVEFKMIFVEGGTFQMESENGYDDEKPVHSVTLSDYYIGETEVTQALWKAVMGCNPSCFNGDNLPVESVSWDDCQKFIKELNKLTGRTFALPTEAQWEYAARGGNKSRGYEYSGSNNIDDVAWYGDNNSSQTHPAGTKMANELGLYDMSGNVWEWCSDRYGDYSSSSQTDPVGPSNGSYRVLRGGGWSSFAGSCRSAHRSYYGPGIHRYDFGFRLVLLFRLLPISM